MATNLQELFGDHKTLTAAIQRVPFKPGLIASLKLFGELGISTTSAFIEYENGRLDLVPAAGYGGVIGTIPMNRTRDGVEIEAVHLPTRGSVLAAEAQNRRAFGTNSLDTPENLRDGKLKTMRGNLEFTIEAHRMGAIRGQILDADGESVLLDTYATFGVTQHTIFFNSVSAVSSVLQKVIDAERAAEDALGGTRPTEFIAMCSPGFIDAIRNHPSYVKAIENAAPAALLSGAIVRISRTTFYEVRSPSPGPTFIADGEAYLLPSDVPDLFISRFAPAPWWETVNTPGLPIYVKAEPMPMGLGYALAAQSNVLNICTRPTAVIRLSTEAS